MYSLLWGCYSVCQFPVPSLTSPLSFLSPLLPLSPLYPSPLPSLFPLPLSSSLFLPSTPLLLPLSPLYPSPSLSSLPSTPCLFSSLYRTPLSHSHSLTHFPLQAPALWDIEPAADPSQLRGPQASPLPVQP